MNKTPDFQMAQDAATNFLLNHDTLGLSFDPRKLNLLPENIIIDSIENYAAITNTPVSNYTNKRIDACYVAKKGDLHLILYEDNSSANQNHKIFGITHELGHIYCGHTKNVFNSSDDKKEEIEANFFAAQVLMPEIVSYHIMYNYNNNRLDTFDLMDIFNVSFIAANKRITTFNNRGCWNSSNKDLRLLEKYKPYIQEHFKKREERYASLVYAI